MITMANAVFIVFLKFGILIKSEASVQHVVDLTFSMNTSTIYWPGNPDYNFTILTRAQLANYWYESNYFGTAEHGGTHLDAPSHFSAGAWRTHQIPVERLIGPGVVINVTSKVEIDSDYRLQIADFEAWESTHGQIPNGAIVLMKSGWSTRYPSKSKVFNTQEPSDPSTFHFPAFHSDAIKWIIRNRRINIIGVDTPSVDYGQSTIFPVHQLLGDNNIPGLENVGYLENIPENGATIFVGVVKLFDGSGGPARIIATYSSDSSSSSCYINTHSWLILTFHLLLLHIMISENH